MYCFECDAYSSTGSRTCSRCGRELSTDADRYFRHGMEYLASGDIGRSADLFADCVALNPEHINGRYHLGLALALAGRLDDAKGHFLGVIQQDPEYPGIYTALGQVAFGSYMYHIEQADRQRQAMMRLYQTAIEVDSEDVDAHFSLANAYLAVGEAETAVPYLRNALALNPESAAIHLALAKALQMLEKYAEAAEVAEQSMQLARSDDPFREDIEDLLIELRERVY